MADLNAIENIHSFLDRVNWVSIEVSGALFKLREILDRTQTAFRSVYLLIEHAPQAGRIQTHPPFLWTNVGCQVKLAGCMTINMAVQTRDAQTWFQGLPII